MKLPNVFESETPPLAFTAGTVIFQEGQPGSEMFIVKSGAVDLRLHGRIVETVEADGFFGEMAVIEGGTRSASAIAQTDCTLIPVNAKRFEFMVHEIPFFAVHVMKKLSQRLRELDKSA